MQYYWQFVIKPIHHNARHASQKSLKNHTMWYFYPIVTKQFFSFVRLNRTPLRFPVGAVYLGAKFSVSLLLPDERKTFAGTCSALQPDILSLLSSPLNSAQSENKPNRISSGPEVSVPFRFGLGERADGLAKAPSPSRDVLTVCEALLRGTYLLTARQLWQAEAGHPTSRSIRAAGNDGRAGTRDEREDMGHALLAHSLLFHSSTCCSQQLLIPVNSH